MNHDTLPLVSVIVPAFNAEHTLRTTLASIAAQTYRALEILIVDDGSTDSSRAIALEFCAQDARARLLSKPNGGVASARNAGIGAARGEFVAPIDADDVWHPEKIERQVRLALSVSNLGFVYTLHRRIDAFGRVLAVQRPPENDSLRVFHQMLYRNLVGNGSALLIPRRLALGVGGYDERLRALCAEGCEDYLLQLKLARCHSVAVVQQYLVGYRKTPGAMSDDGERMFRSWEQALRLFAADGGDVPARLLAWAFAFRALNLVMHRARRGRWRSAGMLMRRAIARDPLSITHLGYGLAHTVARRWRERGHPPSDRPAFDQCDPAEAGQNVDNWLRWSRLLRNRLQDARLARLARIDRGPPGHADRDESAVPNAGLVQRGV